MIASHINVDGKELLVFHESWDMKKREAVPQYKSPNTQILMYKQDANENVKTNLICKQEQWPMDQ
jgi:hypothetical protein